MPLDYDQQSLVLRQLVFKAGQHRLCPFDRHLPPRVSVKNDAVRRRQQRLVERPSLLTHPPRPCRSERSAQLLVDRMRAQRRGGAIDQSRPRRAIMTLGGVGNSVAPSVPRRPGARRPAGRRTCRGRVLSAWSWPGLLLRGSTLSALVELPSQPDVHLGFDRSRPGLPVATSTTFPVCPEAQTSNRLNACGSVKSNVPAHLLHSGCKLMRYDLNRVESAKVLLPAAIDRLAFQFPGVPPGRVSHRRSCRRSARR